MYVDFTLQCSFREVCNAYMLDVFIAPYMECLPIMTRLVTDTQNAIYS